MLAKMGLEPGNICDNAHLGVNSCLEGRVGTTCSDDSRAEVGLVCSPALCSPVLLFFCGFRLAVQGDVVFGFDCCQLHAFFGYSKVVVGATVGCSGV